METVTRQDPETTSQLIADASEPAGLIDAAVTRCGFLCGGAGRDRPGGRHRDRLHVRSEPGLGVRDIQATAEWQRRAGRLGRGERCAIASAGMNMSPAPAPSAAPSSSPVGNIPPGWSEHDINARQVLRCCLGKIAPALKGVCGDAAFAKLADIPAAGKNYPELGAVPDFAQVTQGNEEIKPKIVRPTKVDLAPLPAQAPVRGAAPTGRLAHGAH